MSTKSLRDIRGRELRPGQEIAFADRDGNLARMRIGFIEAVNEAEGKVTISWSGRHWPPKSTVSISGTYVDTPRICVVG